MPTVLLNGVRVPQGTDQSAPQVDMRLLGQSVRTILTASSMTDAINLVSAARTELGWNATPDKPILVLVNNILQEWDGANWTPLTARPGAWTQFAGGCFARLNPVTGMVDLKGLISNASLSEGSAVITGAFPQPFRPTQTVVMPATGFSNGHYGYSCAIRITHDGVFEAINAYKSVLSYIYIGGLSYPIN